MKKHISNFNDFINESKNQDFVVGNIYTHKKYGDFEVFELTKTQNTKVKFLKSGKISYIAGWESDGYEHVSEAM